MYHCVLHFNRIHHLFIKNILLGLFCNDRLLQVVRQHQNDDLTKPTWTCGFDVRKVKWCAADQRGLSEALSCGSSYPGGLVGWAGFATWGPGCLVGPLLQTCQRHQHLSPSPERWITELSYQNLSLSSPDRLKPRVLYVRLHRGGIIWECSVTTKLWKTLHSCIIATFVSFGVPKKHFQGPVRLNSIKLIFKWKKTSMLPKSSR